MGKRILFAPIGGTDPIRYSRDGSMLHICRHYQPDIVYLYLSYEMMEYHKKDNRYIDALERLGEYLHHPFEVKVIERSQLKDDVHQYDRFYQDFREEIRKIEQKMNPEDELLVNMASGTPAMKSALSVLATLAEYRFKPIQVSTPQKKINSEQNSYDNEQSWIQNQDNCEDAPNRCEEVQCLNLMKMFKIDAIKKHIRAYDYTAALLVAKELQKDISEDAYRLLQIADARVKLDRQQISKLMKTKTYDIYPIQDEKKQKIFEYALVLQIKIEKQEYADFIRGVTPIVVDLLESILQNVCGIQLQDCCTKDKKNEIWKWNRKKLNGLGLLTLLDKTYGGFREGPVYSNHIATIIRDRCSDQTMKRNVNAIAQVEKNVRNVAAHQIISVTNEWFRNRTGKTAKEIFTLIQYLIQEAGINTAQKDWKSYDKMNKMIEQYLR